MLVADIVKRKGGESAVCTRTMWFARIYCCWLELEPAIEVLLGGVVVVACSDRDYVTFSIDASP